MKRLLPILMLLSGWCGAQTLAQPPATGTCTNKAVTAVQSGGPTCTTLTSAYVDGSIAPTASPALTGIPTAPTPAATDNSTTLPTTAYVTTAVANAIAAVNPAVAVQAATNAILPNSPTYANGVTGIGAFITTLTLNTALVVDGYTPVLNDRILVKNESGGLGAPDNGVYKVTQVSGVGLAWILTRALDYDQPSDMNNTGAIPVVNGTANASTTWLQTSTVNTVGTDAVTFAQFSLSPTKTVSTTANMVSGNYPSATGTQTTGDSGVTAGPYSIPWITSLQGSATAIAASTVANKAKFWGVVLTWPLTTTQVTYNVGTADNTANTYDLGIYDGSGNLKAHTGSLAGTSFAPGTGTTTKSWTGGAATLQPGKYYIALTSNCAASCVALGGSSATQPTFYNAAADQSISASGTLNGPLTPPADIYSFGGTVPSIVAR